MQLGTAARAKARAQCALCAATGGRRPRDGPVSWWSARARREALAGCQERLGDEHPNTTLILNNLAGLLHKKARVRRGGKRGRSSGRSHSFIQRMRRQGNGTLLRS